MKKYFSTKGYYLVLLLCVAVICISGAYALKNNMSNTDPQDNEYVDPATSSTVSPDNDVDVGSKTLMPAPSKTSPNINPSVSPSGTTATAVPGTVTISLSKPIAGDIINNLAMDKLVYNKTLKEWRTHSGIDIKGNAGDEVKCAAAGTVKDVKSDPRFGPTIIVEHSTGVLTVYSGLLNVSVVKPGQKLAQGEVVGVLADTIFLEKADGIHLHFELQVSGKPVDPSSYFK